eukprot:4247452-Pyramimonas_sp.AAC.1
MREIHGWRASRFQKVVLASALRTIVFQTSRASRIEGGSFSKCGSRLSAAHIRLSGRDIYVDSRRSSLRNWILERFRTVKTQQSR